jgi:transcriptional regulator with XRE-family HTH domain
MKGIAQRIRSIRKSQGLTQLGLCQMVGISKSFLSELENGKRNPSSLHLLELAKALGCSCDYLLTGGELTSAVSVPQDLAEFAKSEKLTFDQVTALLAIHRLTHLFSMSNATHTHAEWQKLFSLLQEYTKK